MNVYFALTTAIVLVATGILYFLIRRQLSVIHTLVNSNLTAVKKDLETALNRIEVLEKLLSDTR